MGKRVIQGLAAILFCAVFAAPAAASSITINSANCSEPTACYGLSWTLVVNPGSYTYSGKTYNYQVFLKVEDDPAVTGTPAVTISAVNFKFSSSITSAALYQVPTSTVLSTWSTSINNLSSGGCGSSSAQFVCSQSSADPANFTASSTSQTWAWYVNAGTPFVNFEGSHIGAKMVVLNKPGKLLSEEFHAPPPPPTTVPEPGSLALLAIGATVVSLTSRRRGRRQQNAA